MDLQHGDDLRRTSRVEQCRAERFHGLGGLANNSDHRQPDAGFYLREPRHFPVSRGRSRSRAPKSRSQARRALCSPFLFWLRWWSARGRPRPSPPISTAEMLNQFVNIDGIALNGTVIPEPPTGHLPGLPDRRWPVFVIRHPDSMMPMRGTRQGPLPMAGPQHCFEFL